MVGMAVAVIHIGSPATGGLGWCVASGPGLRRMQTGRDLDRAIRAIATRVILGPVALGFEAPMFVPPGGRADRSAPAGRYWYDGANPPPGRPLAGAGAASLAVSVAVVVYTLRELKRSAPEACARLDWRCELTRPGDLLLFEVLATRPAAGGGDHEAQAAIAARRAATMFTSGDLAAAIAGAQVFSPVGAAMVRARWREDLAVLAEPCLVVRP